MPGMEGGSAGEALGPDAEAPGLSDSGGDVGGEPAVADGPGSAMRVVLRERAHRPAHVREELTRTDGGAERGGLTVEREAEDDHREGDHDHEASIDARVDHACPRVPLKQGRAGQRAL